MKRSDFRKEFPGRLVPIPAGLVAFIPEPLPPDFNITPRISSLCDEAMIALGGLRQIIPFLPNPKLMTGPFLRREAVLSSKIEGTYTNLEQLYLFEIEGDGSTGNADRSDAREVLNYVVALEHGLNRLHDIPVCGRLLKEMHEILTRGLRSDRGANKQAGEFRNNQAFIGGSREISAARYVAPPAAEINRLFGQFERFVNSQDSTLPALIWIAAIHYQFEAIHPFADGNGRLGRILISLLLAARNLLTEPLLYLSAYFESRKGEYSRRLWEISRAGAWESWIEFFLEGVKHEATDAATMARDLLDCRENFRAEFRSKKGKAADLVDSLFCEPVVTVRGAQGQLGLKTYLGAQKAIDSVVKHGLLTLARERPKIYIAKPIVDILSRKSPADARSRES